MKSSAFAALLLVALSGLAFGEEDCCASTPFHTFMSRPGLVFEVNRPIGSLTSDYARVEIIALAAIDPEHTGHTDDTIQRMRGLKIQLQQTGSSENIYLDSAQVATLIEELAGIEDGVPALENDETAPYRVQGTASCWRPAQPFRILCPSYRVGPDWTGMALNAYGGPSYAFPGHRPAELKALLQQGLAALETD